MFICLQLLGIQTSQDARFYALSKEFKPFSNADKPLVIQFTVKHEQNIDCGGGYAKIFDCSLDQKDMHGDSPYLIMFGKFIFQLVPVIRMSHENISVVDFYCRFAPNFEFCFDFENA